MVVINVLIIAAHGYDIMGLKKFLSLAVTALAFTFTSSTADAGKIPHGWYEATSFVTETNMPGMSLCHLIKKSHIAYLSYSYESRGYVLAEDNCKAESFYSVNATQVEEMQANGLIDPSIPLIPEANFRLRVNAYLLYVVLGVLGPVGLVSKLGGRTGMGSGRRSRSSRASQQTNSRMLAVMCQVAKSDGKIEPGEIATIAHAVKRLTGQDVGIDKITAIIQSTDLYNDLRHLSDIGEGLNENDRLTVLEGALTIAVSDGNIAAEEYSFIQELAHALDIKSDDFRVALRRIAGHLAPQMA